MNYIHYYQSPLGEIILTSDGKSLTGLSYDFPEMLLPYFIEKPLPIFSETDLFQWKKSRLYPETESESNRFPKNGMGYSAHDSVRPNDNLWGNRQPYRKAKRHSPHVRSGGRRRCRP